MLTLIWIAVVLLLVIIAAPLDRHSGPRGPDEKNP